MVKIKKPIPYSFALEALESLDPFTRPMFGCTAIYVEDKIVLVLRDKDSERQDNGVWLGTMVEHHESLKKEFPNMRSIQLLAGGGVTGWQVLPGDSPDFEESVHHACELIRRGDPRIGKVPKKRAKKPAKKRVPKSSKSRRKARR